VFTGAMEMGIKASRTRSKLEVTKTKNIIVNQFDVKEDKNSRR
jgi:hypothetical protein